MKRLLLLLAALSASFVSAAPFELRITQRDAADSNNFIRQVPPIASNVSGILVYNGATTLPQLAGIGSGLTFSGGVLTASGSADWSTLTGKPAWTSAFDGSYASLTGQPSLFDGTWASLTGKPTFATVATSGLYSDLSGAPTIPAAQVNSDWSSVSGVSQILNKPTLSTVATTGAYADLTGKPAIPAAQVNADWNAVSGVAQILNKPTIPVVTAFNFGMPAAKTIAVNTSYQAADPSKAAIITPSFACTNATTVLAASACTLQVRVSSTTATCSSGTVIYTQSLTVGLGLLITQNSTNPVQINLPAGAHFIVCPSAGTFTITAVEQSAG